MCDNRETHGGWGVGVLLQHVTENVDQRQAAQLALGNQICATWTLEGVGYSKHQLQASHVFQRTVGARWNSAAHRGPAIDIQLTGGAAALGPGASCCPGWHTPVPRFPPPAAILHSHPQPRLCD